MPSKALLSHGRYSMQETRQESLGPSETDVLQVVYLGSTAWGMGHDPHKSSTSRIRIHNPTLLTNPPNPDLLPKSFRTPCIVCTNSPSNPSIDLLLWEAAVGTTVRPIRRRAVRGAVRPSMHGGSRPRRSDRSQPKRSPPHRAAPRGARREGSRRFLLPPSYTMCFCPTVVIPEV